MSMRRRIPPIAICAMLISASQLWGATQNDARTTIFRLGQFDRSSGEFASDEPKRVVRFIFAQSDSAKDWFSWQPAALETPAENVHQSISAAPRTIDFSLASAPAAHYSLHLALLIESASVPAVKVIINGREGKFYLHPRLELSNGDQADSFFSGYSSADVKFVFPGNYLHKGVNRIALQAIEDSQEEVRNAGFAYDAIELDVQDEVSPPEVATLQLEPTIFYKEAGGKLKEVVDAFLRHTKPLRPLSIATLTIGGRTYSANLSRHYDFGEERAEFLVDEFSPKVSARLSADLDGRKQNFTKTIDPAKKWTLFLVPHIHVDLGYTDYQAKVAAIQSRTVDEAMEMIARHPEFRFSLDGEWDLEQFLATHGDAQKERAIESIRRRELFVPAQYANLLTGLPTAETLIRSLYPSANFSRIHQTPFDYASITDVPSYSWSYASVLAAAGIHAAVGGSNNYRAPILLQGRLQERSPMWWVGPDGGKVILWYSRHYHQMQGLFGLPPSLQSGRETLPLFLQIYSGREYHADAAMLYGTQVENTDLFPQQAELAGKWNALYAYPHLRYSGFAEALDYIGKQFGNDMPTIRGDGGPYWEDGAASDASYLAIERRTEARAQSAEKLATLVPLVNPLLKTDVQELGDMWKDMVLMDEHTWDSADSVGDPTSMEAVAQLKVKEQFALDAAARVDSITRHAMADIVNAIPAGPGSLIVFNSLNWKRSGPVFIDLDKEEEEEVVDPTTGEPIPFEIVASGKDFNHIRLIAHDVPAVGYKVYSTRTTTRPASNAATEGRSVMESPYYRVELDANAGAIRSIFDKELQRELVGVGSPYRFAQYLYVTGGDKSPNTILQYSKVYPRAQLTVHPAQNGRVVSVRNVPGGEVALLESDDLNTPKIRTQIRLDNHEKSIEISEEIEKKEVLEKEAVYFAFPFAAEEPKFQYEVQNGAVDPARDMYPGAGHEWFSVQHWVSVEQNGLSASILTLEAPLVTLGDINRGAWPEEFGKRSGTVYSYAMNNYWDTNYRAAQGGRFTFHFVITSASSTDARRLSRLGWEKATPLETDKVTSQDKAVVGSGAVSPSVEVRHTESQETTDCSQNLSGQQQSFMEVSDPDILLETWKPAEDGNGTILRFLDLGGEERSVGVRIPCAGSEQVTQTDAVERDQSRVPVDEKGRFHFTVHPHEIVTLRLSGGRH